MDILSQSGFLVEEIVRTFINPWFCEATKFLASEEKLNRSPAIFNSMIQLGHALRHQGEHRLFSEVLFICKKP